MTPNNEITRMNVKRAAAYFVIQSICTIIWWLGLLLSPTFERMFFSDRLDRGAWISLMAPDLIFYVGLSAAAAYALICRPLWSKPLLLLLIGATGYATTYTVALVTSDQAELISAVLMILSLVATIFFGRDAFKNET